MLINFPQRTMADSRPHAAEVLEMKDLLASSARRAQRLNLTEVEKCLELALHLVDQMVARRRR